MKFDINCGSAGELCEKLRQIKLKDGKTQPYLNSYISIEMLDPAILAPTQRYCLISELKKIEQLRWDILNEFNWDILQLNGYLEVIYKLEKKGEFISWGAASRKVGEDWETKQIDILPPIIEEHVNSRGGIDLIICDGQHRCRLAYQMGMPLNVIYVRGANKSYPYYAYPLPNGWDDVELRDDIPEGYVKKFHVAKEHKRLYRDFNTQFSNIGDSRPYTTVEEKKAAGVYGVRGSDDRALARGFDPEIEKAKLKEEMEAVKLGEYGVIGSPYQKKDKEDRLMDVLRASADPATELGKALEATRKSFNEYRKKIEALKPGEKLGIRELDLDKLYNLYQNLSPEVRKELEEIRNNLSAAGREAHEKFFSAIGSIEDFFGKKKDEEK